MSLLVVVLAVIGFVAVALRVVLAILGLLRRGVDRYLADSVADVRARRGDLTGMDEARVEEQGARRALFSAFAILSFWALLLIAPALTPWPRTIYAAYSVFWLLPSGFARVR